MKKCPMCYEKNDNTAKTCTNCGADLQSNPESELMPDTSKTVPEVEAEKLEELIASLNQQKKILSEMYKHTVIIDQNISAIRGWVTFLGIIVLISLIVAFIQSCNASLGL